MQIDLTQDEMSFIANMFNGASVGILDPKTVNTATMAQGIIAKFQVALAAPAPTTPQEAA